MEAKEALDDVRYLKSLIAQTRGSLKQSADYLVIWGLVWLAGYVATAAGLPDGLGGLMWWVLIAAGLAASIPRWVRIKKGGGMPLLGRLWLWSGLAVLGTGVTVLLLMQIMGLLNLVNLDSPFWGYFSAVWVGLWYMLGGFLMGRGMTLLGAWLVVLGFGIPLAGLALPVAYAALGVLGGGTLIATGLLARRGGSYV